MLARVTVLLAALSLAAGQAEQTILAQFIYPPVAVPKEIPRKTEVTTLSPTEPDLVSLEVLPLLARSRRSGFNRDKTGGNDVVFNQYRQHMTSPGWVPEIFPRFGGEKISKDYD